MKCGYSNCNYRLGKSWSLDDNCCYNPRKIVLDIETESYTQQKSFKNYKPNSIFKIPPFYQVLVSHNQLSGLNRKDRLERAFSLSHTIQKPTIHVQKLKSMMILDGVLGILCSKKKDGDTVHQIVQ